MGAEFFFQWSFFSPLTRSIEDWKYFYPSHNIKNLEQSLNSFHLHLWHLIRKRTNRNSTTKPCPLSLIIITIIKTSHRLHKIKNERLSTMTRNKTMINRTTITKTQKWGKNNCMDISSDKQAKSDTRRLGHG